MNKAIITVVGQDTVGIIARVCTYLSEHQVNVLDISQTIIDGFFNMMMIVDYSNADKEFGADRGRSRQARRGDWRAHPLPARGDLYQDAPRLIRGIRESRK